MTPFTAYPEGLDNFTPGNPTEFDQLSLLSEEHHKQESQQNDAITAIEAKLGITNSADTSSFDYRLRQLEGSVGSPITTTTGTGSPEGAVVGGIGRIYFDIANVDAIAMWVKSTAGGNTGWKQQSG